MQHHQTDDVTRLKRLVARLQSDLALSQSENAALSRSLDLAEQECEQAKEQLQQAYVRLWGWHGRVSALAN